jgi:hypothetical protein
MTLQAVVEVILAVGAAFLLLRDVRRAARDRLRRPVTLLVAALIAVLLIGVVGGQSHPSPWWLLVPGGILAWEVARGWRVVPRCHLREAGVGAFALGLVLAAFGFGMSEASAAIAFLATAAAAGCAALVLFWLSHRREPLPWRADDMKHYERRSIPRP